MSFKIDSGGDSAYITNSRWKLGWEKRNLCTECLILGWEKTFVECLIFPAFVILATKDTYKMLFKTIRRNKFIYDFKKTPKESSDIP